MESGFGAKISNAGSTSSRTKAADEYACRRGLVPVGVDATALPNTTIVLTREIIETALNAPHQPLVNVAPGIIITTPKPSIMVFNFVDTFKPNDGRR